MRVSVLFFGATADETGKRSVEFTIEDSASARTALGKIVESFPPLRNHKLRFAVNQEYVHDECVLREGDELAIFTAVSGG
jgi:molybdopterin synthase sulfur carrier subunit